MKSCFLIFCTILFQSFQTISSDFNREALTKETAVKDYIDELGHERYARHIEVITESVIDHLLREVKKKLANPNRRTSHQQLSRVAQKIKNKIKQLRKKKTKKTKKIKHRTKSRTMKKPKEQNGTRS